MKKDSIINNIINTNADSNLKGIDLQKFRAIERLLKALLSDKKCVFCTIEYIDDVIELDFSNELTKIETEQNKNYSKSLSLNSEEVKNSLRIFFDTWRKVEESESISFVFYTNAEIAKESRVGVLKEKFSKLPNKPLIQLLIDKEYEQALPYVIPIIKSYYVEQYKKHSEDISYYSTLIEGMGYAEWESFFSLIEWKFNKDDELTIKKNIEMLINQLCVIYNVEQKYSDKILASMYELVSSRALEKDFLNKLVHVSEIKVLFIDFVTKVKTEERLDPMYKKWDELISNDVRDLGEKILNVCPSFDEDLLFEYEDDFIDGKFEQEHYVDKRSVKAYNYRIYKVCKKHIRGLLKINETSEFCEDEIVDIVNELTDKSMEYILDKSKTYKVPYLDRDMAYKAVLILFQECFLSLDKAGDQNGQ